MFRIALVLLGVILQRCHFAACGGRTPNRRGPDRAEGADADAHTHATPRHTALATKGKRMGCSAARPSKRKLQPPTRPTKFALQRACLEAAVKSQKTLLAQNVSADFSDLLIF
jgi:hypothetical protein